ncbi:MAG: AsmA family protein [Magnetococcales bacterium]|nr:AsmA family protein [Magnetococcales bacterium]
MHITLRKSLKIALTIMTCWIVVMIVAAYILKPAHITDQAKKIIQAQTGFTVAVSGPFTRTIFPWFGFHTGPIKVDHEENQIGSPLLSLSSLTARIRLWPLLFGEIKLDHIILETPRITLNWHKDGTPPWGRVENTKKTVENSETALLEELSIAGLTVNNGSISIKQPKTDFNLNIYQIALDTGAISNREVFPFTLAGTVIDTAMPLSAKLALKGGLSVDFNSGNTSLSATTVKADVTGGVIPKSLGDFQLFTTVDFNQKAGHILAKKFLVKAADISLYGLFSGQKLFDKPELYATIQAKVDKNHPYAMALKDIQAKIRLTENLTTTTMNITGPAGEKFRGDAVFIKDFSGSKTLTVGGELNGLNSASISSIPPPLHGELQSRFAIDSKGESLDELLHNLQISIQTTIKNQGVKAKLHKFGFKAFIDYDRKHGHLSVNQAVLTAAKNSLHFNVETLGLGSDDWQTTGDLDGQRLNIDALLRLAGQQPPATTDPNLLKNTSIRFNFANSATTSKIAGLKLKIGELTLHGHGGLEQKNIKKITFSIWGDRLDVDKFTILNSDESQNSKIAKSEEKPLSLTLDLLDELQWSGDVTVDELLVNGLSFSKLNLQTHAANGKSATMTLEGNFAKGKMSSNITAKKTKTSQEFTIKFRLNNGEVGPLVASLAEKKFLKGKLQIFTNLTGTGYDVVELKKSLQGRSGITIAKGEITKFADGSDKKDLVIPFKKIFGHFQVKDGVFHTNYLRIKGPTLTASGKGNIDLPENSVDMAINATYNKIVKIPVTIKGDLAEPEVVVDMESLVVDTSGNILDLPWTVLDKILEKIQQ